jgi:GNAT superfamily N-acetyltransferase
LPYSLSTDPALLDLGRVHAWLSTDAYWALGRSAATVAAAAAASLNVGAYDESGGQVGYARVVTDRATFAWLCDVYVAPEHRGHGLGDRLVARVLTELAPLDLTRVLLATADAHGLYARHGFVPAPPDRMMERRAATRGSRPAP